MNALNQTSQKITLRGLFNLNRSGSPIMKEGIKMLTLVFIICMIAVFGKIAGLALRGAWGLTKILLSLVFLPIILIGMVFSGLIVIALPALVIFGIMALVSDAS